MNGYEGATVEWLNCPPTRISTHKYWILDSIDESNGIWTCHSPNGDRGFINDYRIGSGAYVLLSKHPYSENTDVTDGWW